MAKTKELSLTLGIKLNLGNYQSAHVEVAQTVELEPGEDVATAYAALRTDVVNRLNTEAQMWKTA